MNTPDSSCRTRPAGVGIRRIRAATNELLGIGADEAALPRVERDRPLVFLAWTVLRKQPWPAAEVRAHPNTVAPPHEADTPLGHDDRDAVRASRDDARRIPVQIDHQPIRR